MLTKAARKKRERTAIGGTRKIIRLGGSLVIALPSEFVDQHGLKEGDDLPYAANHIIKYIPMMEK